MFRVQGLGLRGLGCNFCRDFTTCSGLRKSQPQSTPPGPDAKVPYHTQRAQYSLNIEYTLTYRGLNVNVMI